MKYVIIFLSFLLVAGFFFPVSAQPEDSAGRDRGEIVFSTGSEYVHRFQDRRFGTVCYVVKAIDQYKSTSSISCLK